MGRLTAALLAAALSGSGIETAAGAPAPAASPFEEVPNAPPPRQSHLLAYATLGTGAALIGASFVFSHHADDLYAQYLGATDPNEITDLYDRTVTYDRLSSGSLLGGEVLVLTGLYLRFLHAPKTSRVSLGVGPRTCALSLRF